MPPERPDMLASEPRATDDVLDRSDLAPLHGRSGIAPDH